MGYLEHVGGDGGDQPRLRLRRPSYGAHSNLCVNQIRRNGTQEQKRRYLPKLITGEHVGALAMSEPGAGSDVVSMRTARRQARRPLCAERHQDVDHQRAQCRCAGGLCQDRSRRRRRAASPRFWSRRASRVSPPRQKLDKLGMRGSNTCELVFQDCEVPEENVLGAVGQRRERADERAGLRARGAGGGSARHHAGLHGRRAALCARAQAVRPADRRVPAHAGQARRHVHDDERGAGLCLRGGEGLRPRAGHAQGRRRRDPLRRREGDLDGAGSDPGLGRQRLYQRLSRPAGCCATPSCTRSAPAPAKSAAC